MAKRIRQIAELDNTKNDNTKNHSVTDLRKWLVVNKQMKFSSTKKMRVSHFR